MAALETVGVLPANQECYTVKGEAMYTTIKGNQIELTPANWKKIRRCAAKRLGEWSTLFNCTSSLFDACWKEYRATLRGACAPTCIGDVTAVLEVLISERVNNPRSKFYIYG